MKKNLIALAIILLLVGTCSRSLAYPINCMSMDSPNGKHSWSTSTKRRHKADVGICRNGSHHRKCVIMAIEVTTTKTCVYCGDYTTDSYTSIEHSRPYGD